MSYDKLMEERTDRTFPFTLTVRQSAYLSDRLAYQMLSPTGDKVNPSLILKIGSALLESHEKTRSTVQVTLSELYLIRDIVHSVDMMGQETVGIDILMQVYKGLLHLEDESLVPLQEGSTQEDSYAERKAKASEGHKSEKTETENKSEDPYSSYY